LPNYLTTNTFTRLRQSPPWIDLEYLETLQHSKQVHQYHRIFVRS